MAKAKNVLNTGQIEYLKENYLDKTNKELGDHLGYSKSSIQRYLTSLNLSRKNNDTSSLEGEEWCYIDDPEIDLKDRYAVSNMGRILNIEKDRILTPVPDAWGYLKVKLYADGKYKLRLVHRLVAFAFCDMPEEYEDNWEVNHLKGVKTDNRSTELEWSTPSDNQKHAYATGLREANKGEDSVLCKYSEKDAALAKELYSKGTPISQISTKVGISKSYLHNIFGGNRRETK